MKSLVYKEYSILKVILSVRKNQSKFKNPTSIQNKDYWWKFLSRFLFRNKNAPSKKKDLNTLWFFFAFDFDYNPHGHWFSFLLVHHYSDENLIKKLKWNNPTVLLTYLHTGKIKVRLFVEFGKENSIFFINYFFYWMLLQVVPFLKNILDFIGDYFFIPNDSKSSENLFEQKLF